MQSKIYILYVIVLISFFSCRTRLNEEQSNVDSTLAVPSNNQLTNEPESIPFENSSDDIETYDHLFELLTKNEFESARALINEKKLDINAYEQSLASMMRCFTTLLYRFSGSTFYSSTYKENVQAVEFLLQLGVDPNTLSTVTCEEGFSTDVTDTCNPEIGEMLIKAGSHYALNGLLDCAAKNKNLDKVNELLDRGGDPSLALSVACEIHNHELFEKLLNLGVNKDIAFYWAVAHEDLELARMMIEKGARLKEINPVAKSQNTKLRELVIPWANPQAYTELTGGEGFCDGNELMFMVRENNYNAVEFILRIGANPNIYCWEDPLSGKLDCNTTSALGIAEGAGNSELIELLKKYGAKKPENCK